MKVKDIINSQKKALLFDLDRNSIALIKEVMADFGFEVEVVEKGFTGFYDAQEYTTNIIIADIDYPGFSGFDILDGIRGRNLNIPVILTGDSTEGNILRAFRNGASDYLRKPLDRSLLKERISDILSKQHTGEKTSDNDSILRHLENMERNNKELTNLLKISSSLDISADSKEILNRLTELAAESMNCEAASILLINDRKNILEFVVATGEKKQRLETVTVPIGEGIAGWVALHGESQVVNDAQNDPHFTGKVDAESGFVTRQILAIPLCLENRIIGVLEVINSKDNRVLGEDDLRKLTRIGERVPTIIATTKTIENQQNFYIQTTNIIVKAIEKKDMFSEGHPWKVAELCHKISLSMNLSENEKNDLHFGALFHDIGKIDMPSLLFNKRKLSEHELEYIRQHPVKGAKLLEPIILWKAVVPLVLYHHEAWDGSGYPFGRSGNSIPLAARIICLAEAFSVMRSPNTYKKRMSLKEAVLEIMRQSGKQFDPVIVKIFISALEKDLTIK